MDVGMICIIVASIIVVGIICVGLVFLSSYASEIEDKERGEEEQRKNEEKRQKEIGNTATMIGYPLYDDDGNVMAMFKYGDDKDLFCRTLGIRNSMVNRHWMEYKKDESI